MAYNKGEHEHQGLPGSHGEEQPHNPYASASRWRHQEPSAYAEYARDPHATGNTEELASYINTSRVDGQHGAGGHQDVSEAAAQAQTDGHVPGGANDGREIVCGPLLNYRRTVEGRWHGSVLIVVKGGGPEVLYQPALSLRRVGDARAAAQEAAGQANPAPNAARTAGERLYSDKRNTFWVFDLQVPVEQQEIQYEYEIPDMRFSSNEKPRANRFFVPAANESMRVMFHSCNGFSVGTDEEAFSGTPLWRDVLRKHAAKPFHVMLGGGDQIYNDGIRVSGPLREWTDIGNPKKRREYPFREKLRAACDDYYLNNYIRWYNAAPFAIANGQIPQVNIWDDHDIIDGFGSYVKRFMRCDVFRGIGGTAHKYYMLFQHHMAPPPSTYTTDHQSTTEPDPAQLQNTYVAKPNIGSQYIIGAKPGPYVEERSFNMFTRLGARMAMVGIDARTERTRHQVNYPETYKLIWERVRSELQAAASSGQSIQHLILLLGVPIAYPRLTWLENILRSPLIGPIKFMNRRFGLGGGLFNHFDGSVDLLDDLDDHYTAKTHKVERRNMIESLQQIAKEFSVRVTILGGDVHLGAMGRFYSNPKLKIPAEQDNRYMANVVSSAIVNKPPPQVVANLLAARNKIHHLNSDTDETMMDLFNKDPGTSDKTADSNHCTMPSRNFAMLSENSPHNPATAGEADAGGDSTAFVGRDGHSKLHKGEANGGTEHKAANNETFGNGNCGGLDIRLNVEIDQHDAEGRTQPYGLTVPLLQLAQSA